ncbi:Glycosyl hydrolases family 2, TIM barrel domain [Mariniphaga anaerophila]|uniref:Glycosyl hydrolases family 2, TIM barrel domain n=1 Tax=Mariniphaga anaerophila TaxID=1484053 RepID=A0A1M5BN73_9BACT|nr:glycoside hydrolase family 2 TIM barrel-domain containing protein [Mariniphaga anaerophila]SHF44004.1 Glycosyl hydrolases family 2, TIM barrel domain [Mariniphaga anaerophila]
MKFKLIIYTSLTFLTLILLGFFSLRNLNKNKPVDETRKVYIKKTRDGYQLFRNGNPFFIQGAGGDSYFKELAECGGNTIRLYDTLNLASKLDEAHKYNLAVIVDLPLYRFETSYNQYLIKEDVDLLKQEIQAIVKQHKNHPALLMWNLGNEIQYPVVFAKNRIAQNTDDVVEIFRVLFQRKKFIRTFNELIEFIHTEDPEHPVTTSVATNKFWKKLLNIHLYSPKIDIIGYNIFAPPQIIKSQLDKLSKLIHLKPFYISEWGIEGPWAQEKTSWGAPIETTSTNKGKQYKDNYSFFTNHYSQSLGSAVFFWGQKQERTHTWFNIFDEDGRKSQAYCELQKIWKKSSTSFEPPDIKYMLVNKKGAKDNMVFLPNSLNKAEVLLNSKIDSALQIHWEIHEEGWNYEGGGAKHKITKKISVRFEQIKNNEVTFLAPEHEGPYRIFAYVYDKDGYFATTNTPFYVLKKK